MFWGTVFDFHALFASSIVPFILLVFGVRIKHFFISEMTQRRGFNTSFYDNQQEEGASTLQRLASKTSDVQSCSENQHAGGRERRFREVRQPPCDLLQLRHMKSGHQEGL